MVTFTRAPPYALSLVSQAQLQFWDLPPTPGQALSHAGCRWIRETQYPEAAGTWGHERGARVHRYTRASLKEGVEQKSIIFSFPMPEMFLTRGQDPRLSPCCVLSVPPDKATLSFGRVGKGLPCPKTQAAWEQMTRGSQHKSKSEEQSKTWPSHSPTPIPPGSPNPRGTAAQARPISNPPLR